MSNIDTMSVNAIRVLAADAVQKANSGHPGLPLGSAAMAYELWAKHMNHNPANPDWPNRDRFILSIKEFIKAAVLSADVVEGINCKRNPQDRPDAL